jgi:3-oxoacyl-(acyl-carrier-protein) synthase
MASSVRPVVITGLGPVSAVGVGTGDFWAALRAGRCDAPRRTLPVDVGRTLEMPIVSMPANDAVPGLDKPLGFLADQECPGYRDLAYAMLAVQLALKDAGVDYNPERNNIGVIQVFEAPGVEATVRKLFELLSSGPPPTAGPPRVYDLLAPCFYSMQAFLYVHLMGKGLSLHGFSTSVHNACTSGAFAIEVAAQRIRSGEADLMIVAGGEAFDTGVRLEWFHRLDLYAKDTSGMKPFDSASNGFYVGEGGAAMVLESAEHAAQRGATPYAVYAGGAFAHQGWKQTVPDVRAARLRGVIEEALRSGEVAADRLDLIIPHGASTSLSDGYESACLSEGLAGRAKQAVAAVLKPYTGHLLASSGIIEIIGALLAMKHGCVPATPHTSRPNGSLPVPLVTQRTERTVNTFLKLSTGFTGHDAALLFRRG